MVPRGVSGAVSLQWIPLWFLSLHSRLHYLSREKEGRQPKPLLDGALQAPDKWLCAAWAEKKALAGVAAIMGAREKRKGIDRPGQAQGLCAPRELFFKGE